MKKSAPAAQRNREAILDVLRRVLPAQAAVLEIASGTGEHGIYFAEQLTAITWQPSDGDREALSTINAWRVDAGNARVAKPIVLDVTDKWPTERVDAVFCANMIHISPWACTEALFRGAAQVLTDTGQVILYGPYRIDGQHTAPSNEQFDGWLKAQDPSWGVRDLTEVERVAGAAGLTLDQCVTMPANNFILVFLRC